MSELVCRVGETDYYVQLAVECDGSNECQYLPRMVVVVKMSEPGGRILCPAAAACRGSFTRSDVEGDSGGGD